MLTLRSKVQKGKLVVAMLLALKRMVSFSAPKIMASSNNMARRKKVGKPEGQKTHVLVLIFVILKYT